MNSNPSPPPEAGSLSRPSEAMALMLIPAGASTPPPLATLLRRPGKAVHRPSPSLVAQRKPSHAISRRQLQADAWFAQMLHSRWETYCNRLDEWRNEHSVEAVHQLRVACRRLRAVFLIMNCVVPGRPPQKAQRILKGQLQSLGTLRDTHVQRCFIDQQVPAFPELLVLRRDLERQERDLLKFAAREIGHFRTRKLEKRISRLIAHLTLDPGDASKQQELTMLALRRADEAFEIAAGRRAAIDLSDLRTIHKTRVAFKKFRYLVEALPPEATGFGKRHLRNLAYYQRRMGIIQDLEVIQKGLTDFLQRHEGTEALFAPFRAYLRRRRTRALRCFCKASDQLLQFWPPPAIGRVLQAARQQRAA